MPDQELHRANLGEWNTGDSGDSASIVCPKCGSRLFLNQTSYRFEPVLDRTATLRKYDIVFNCSVCEVDNLRIDVFGAQVFGVQGA